MPGHQEHHVPEDAEHTNLLLREPLGVFVGFVNDSTQPMKHDFQTASGPESFHLNSSSAPGNDRATDQKYPCNRQTAYIDELNHDTPNQSSMWAPRILHWTSLTAFGLLFIVALSALEILQYFSRKHDGIAQADAKDYYLWTYGPTAGIFYVSSIDCEALLTHFLVLSIIGALWSQVEYRMKQVKPWQVLRHGPSEATSSILLDYISPWNVISLFRSIKARHYTVALTILATLLIRLLIVFSTGLLLLQPIVVQDVPTRLVASDRFSSDGFMTKSIDGTAVLTVSGAELLNLTLPNGTTRDYAYQSFSAPKALLAPILTMTGFVDTFTADLDCHPASLLRYHSACIGQCEYYGRHLQLAAADCVTEDFQAFKESASWPNSFEASISTVKCLDSPSQEDNRRLVLAAGNFSSIPEANFTGNESLPFAGLVCKPLYEISQRNVSLSSIATLEGIDLSSNSVSHPLPGVTPWTITTAVLSSMNLTSSLISDWSRASAGYDPLISLDTFFIQLNMTAPQQNASSFLNETLLYDVARRTFRSLAVQIAKQYLTTVAADEFVGSSDINENRLCVHKLSLRAMEATLAVLIVITGVIVINRPRHVAARDPGSIVGISSILSSSTTFVDMFSMVDFASVEKLKKILSGRRFKNTLRVESTVLTFGIEDTSGSDPTKMQAKRDFDRLEWWRPFSVTSVARAFVLVCPIALIAVLEVTYQVSHRYNGIADVSPDSYIHYSWVYVPAVVMLGIRAIFDTVDFTARVFQPYCTLRRRSARPERSIFVDYLAKTSIHAFYEGLSKHHFGVVCTSAIMFMAPFLMIVTSGLFTSEHVYQITPVTIDRLDWFNASALSSSAPITTKADLVSSLLMETNLDYPGGTLNGLAFPTVALPASVRAAGPSNTLQTRLPALRGVLNCSLVPAEKILMVRLDSSGFFLIGVDLGAQCADGGETVSGPNGQPYNISYTTAMAEGVNNGSYFGLFNFNLFHTGDCPPFMACYGQANGTSLDNVNVMTCIPQVEQVDVDTTFSLPDYHITSAAVDEASASSFVQDTSLLDNRDIRSAVQDSINTNEYYYDNVFSVLVHGSRKIQGTAIMDFMGAGNAGRISAALSNLFSIVSAQIFNFDVRISSPPSTALSNDTTSLAINGTLRSMGRTRLQQSLTSTRILDGLLAAMIICVALSFLLMSTDKILPLNPCSIAARASLLAGSQMLNPKSGLLPPGSEWCDDRYLRARFAHEGKTFSLRWWEADVTKYGGQMNYRIDFDESDR